MRDLTSPRLMCLKAGSFLLIGFVSAALLWLENFTLQTAFLLVLCIWAFCRAYYFAFYVLERYVDPQFRFSGLASLLMFLLKRRRTPKP